MTSQPGAAGSRRLALAPEPDRAADEPSRATGEPDRATLRATASHLADQALSNREIGRRLGISKDKVKRLLDELAAEQAADASHSEPDRAVPETARATPETPGATGAPQALPPGTDRMRLDLTPQMRADLDTLMDGGLLEDDAIALGLSALAGAVRHAWDEGICPRGLLPDVGWYVGPPRQHDPQPNSQEG